FALSSFLYSPASAPLQRSPLSLHDALPISVAGAGLGDHVLADAVEFLQYGVVELQDLDGAFVAQPAQPQRIVEVELRQGARERTDRKSTRLNSSHQIISYAVFC